jgi:hypothetical protein
VSKFCFGVSVTILTLIVLKAKNALANTIIENSIQPFLRIIKLNIFCIENEFPKVGQLPVSCFNIALPLTKVFYEW